jgi:hypothetical protein
MLGQKGLRGYRADKNREDGGRPRKKANMALSGVVPPASARLFGREVKRTRDKVRNTWEEVVIYRQRVTSQEDRGERED